MDALDTTISFMIHDPESTLDLLLDVYDYDRKTLKTYLYESNMVFDDEILGVDTFVDFMYRNDYIDHTYEKDVLIWQND